MSEQDKIQLFENQKIRTAWDTEKEMCIRDRGSDTTPIRNAPGFAVWAVVCDSLSKAELYPLSSAKANVGRFAGDCDKSFFAAWYPLMEVGDGCL